MSWFRARARRRVHRAHPLFIRSVPGRDVWIWGRGTLAGDLAKVSPEFDGPFQALGELAADEPPFTEIGFLDPRR